MLDPIDYLLYLGPTLGPLIIALVFRKRIGRAFARMILTGTPEFIEDFLWEEAEEVIEGKKVKVKRLRKPVAAQLEALAPALIVPILKSIKINIPKNLPLNAKGELDFAGPLLQKALSGKKLNAQDLLMPLVPMGVELAQVAGAKLQGAIEGLAGKVKPAAGATALSPEAQAIVDKALKA